MIFFAKLFKIQSWLNNVATAMLLNKAKHKNLRLEGADRLKSQFVEDMCYMTVLGDRFEDYEDFLNSLTFA